MSNGFLRQVTAAWIAGVLLAITVGVWAAISGKVPIAFAWLGESAGVAWSAARKPVPVPSGLVIVAVIFLCAWVLILFVRLLSSRTKSGSPGDEAAMRDLEDAIVTHLAHAQTWVRVTQVIDAANLPDELTTGALDRLYKRGTIRYKDDPLNGTCACLSAIGIAYAKRLGLLE
jgi:hypothetical protein